MADDLVARALAAAPNAANGAFLRELATALESALRERDALKHDLERTYASLQGEMNARVEAEAERDALRVDLFRTCRQVGLAIEDYNDEKERADALLAALRDEAIKRAPNISGRTEPAMVCNLCRGRWKPDTPESHAADCLVRPKEQQPNATNDD